MGAMNPRFQIFGTRVLGTPKGRKFVTQRLTVLLSYAIVACVPLVCAMAEWKMAIVRTEANRSEGAMRCQVLMHPGWVKR
jgi:hypothetical protein